MTEEPITILIVDDKEEIRLLLREFLRIEGYHTIEASNGDRAVELARADKPALILMDIMMPGRDGLSAIQDIRATDPLVGIIVLTAFSTEQHAIRALRVGADDYMHKPFEPIELRTKVMSVLGKCSLRKENQRLQNRLTTILERYFPSPVARKLIESPDLPRLGGERQIITVLFADLRGFTGFTSITPPEELIQHLNRYLSVAAEAIFKHNGTLDKFMGDGVMAVFNAPIADHDHLMNAIRAALDIHAQVELMPVEPSLTRLQFGIGIHTGEAVVGNIGAASLMEYTAIGDTVNVTKRLEEYARPGQTLVSRAVAETLGDRIVARPLEPVRIKGRAEPELVFEVAGIQPVG